MPAIGVTGPTTRIGVVIGTRPESDQARPRRLGPRCARRAQLSLWPPVPCRGDDSSAVVSRDTNNREFAARRQRFPAEPGYAYHITDAACSPGPPYARDALSCGLVEQFLQFANRVREHADKEGHLIAD